MTTTEPTKPNGAPAPAAAIVHSPQHSVQRQAESGSIAAFASQANFEAAQRMAKALSQSTMVPDAYRGNLPNCLVAMELAARTGGSVFMVMQNLDVIHGRPAWRSQYIIGTVNSSRKFSPLRFKYEGQQGTDSWGCRAYARDRESGEECVGALITIGMAKAEGWYNKNGSKWKTMPEQMLMYRSAAFWGRVYHPEGFLGLKTDYEVYDTEGYEVIARETPAALIPGSTKELEAELLKPKAVWQQEGNEVVNQETGEAVVLPKAAESSEGKAQARRSAKAVEANPIDDEDYPEPGSDG